MISEEKFVTDVKEICSLSAELEDIEPWVLKETFGRNWIQQSSVVACPEFGRLVRVASVCYSGVYNVPVFWFNIYDIDGKIVHLDKFGGVLIDRFGEEISGSVTQNEHPFIGTAFYNFHPCKTAELMRPLHPRNYVFSFLSTLNTLFGRDYRLYLSHLTPHFK